MLSLLPVVLALAASASALPWGGHGAGEQPQSSTTATATSSVGAPISTTEARGLGESHVVTLVNKCGSGNPVFITSTNPTPQGSTTVNGPLYGGVAWVDGFADANCLMSGVNCGTVEFTLISPTTDGANPFNSINYSLQSQGNHNFVYPMNFAYTGSCAAAPLAGPCESAANCPGAFVGTNTASGSPVDIQGADCGIAITFC